MTNPQAMAEVWRGSFLECVHQGHAAVFDSTGIVSAWGDPDAVILPRSSCKMIQALPLLESGAADAVGLTSQHLALCCASHLGADIHTVKVRQWLKNLELSEADLRCGPQLPGDHKARNVLIRANQKPGQVHNYCSGKHTGFLTFNKHINGGSEYIEADHPVQLAIRETFEDLTGHDSMGHAIDGCSAPNFATTISGLARAMAYFAGAKDHGSLRQRSAVRLVEAMTTHPELVAGENNGTTDLIRASDGRVAIKSGAEGVYVAILPDLRLGVALKIVDGANRASQCAMAAILVSLGALQVNHPLVQKYLTPVQRNRRGIDTGFIRPAAGFPI